MKKSKFTGEQGCSSNLGSVFTVPSTVPATATSPHPDRT
jgi:hypothetical protein